MPKRRRIPRGKKLAYVGLGVLAVTTAAVVAMALTPPIPTSPQVARYSAAPTATTTDGALAVQRPANGPLRVVFAGDSLTYGLSASSEAKGYRPQVVAGLSESGPVEASRGGQTGNRIKTVADSIKFPVDTNLVVLALGTNDVWKTDVGDVASQYKALVAKVNKSAPDAQLVCLGVWSNADGTRNYDPPIQAACEDGGGKFISIGDIYEDEKNRGPEGKPAFGGISDKFHPNDAGYKAIADRLLSFVSVE